jgi:Cu(I)-responsive transcriptional regulator
MSGQEIGIGDLARTTGCKVQTIRYYEEIGLMPEPARTAGNQRRYGQRHVDRLAFIRHSRELGFSLEAIRELLSLSDRPEQPCDAVDHLARRQLEQVERRLARLTMLKNELKRMLEQCAGGKVRDCRVIEVLADHDQCLHNHHSEAGDHATV